MWGKVLAFDFQKNSLVDLLHALGLLHVWEGEGAEAVAGGVVRGLLGPELRNKTYLSSHINRIEKKIFLACSTPARPRWRRGWRRWTRRWGGRRWCRRWCAKAECRAGWGKKYLKKWEMTVVFFFLKKKNELTLPCVIAPTKAGTANPGMVAAMLDMPIRSPA